MKILNKNYINGSWVDWNGDMADVHEAATGDVIAEVFKDPQGNIFVAEAAGPWIVDAERGDSVQAGFRVQTFTLVAGRR